MRSQSRLMGLARGVTDAELARGRPIFDRVLSAVAASSGTEDARQRVETVLTREAMDALAFTGTPRDVLVQHFSRTWFRYFVQYDPAAFLSRLRIPVLAINGSLDQQVPADENLAAIAAALSGNPDTTVRKLEGLNHMFQSAETGALGEYPDIPETFAPVALEVISTWINARFGTDADPHAGTR